MSETSNMVLTRRSIRGFSDKPIPEDKMELIVQAGLHALSGMRLQTWQFTVTRNKEKIQMPAAAVEKTLDHQGYDAHQSWVLAIPSNEEEGRFGRENDACAMKNMFLAAHPLGVSSVWISRFQGIYDESVIHRVLASFGVPANHVVHGMIAPGYTAGTREDKEHTGKMVYVDQSAFVRLVCR